MSARDARPTPRTEDSSASIQSENGWATILTMAWAPNLRAELFRGAGGRRHRPDDVGEQLLAEVGGDLRRLHVGLDLVQVLQAQDVVVGDVGDDSGEEEAERLQLRAELAGAGVGQRQVEADPVDPAPAQLAQPGADEVRK